jgi:hypothetical protein
MLRLLGRQDAETEFPSTKLKRPVSSKLVERDNDFDDDRGL